jgi:LPXTG-motif cell wall-anchored protein
MERLRTALVAALVLMVVSAAPALAQRDPFDPVDSQGSGSGSSGDSTDGPFTQPQTGDSSDDTGSDTSGDSNGNGNDPTQPDANPAPGDDNDPEVQPNDDTLPNTGAEPVSWLVMAYALIAVGGGFVIAGRFLHPQFVSRSEVPRRYQPRHSVRRR